MNSYTDEHGRIVPPVEPGPIVQTVDFASFCEDIRYMSLALGKTPVPPEELPRWLETKFKLVAHLSLQRWIEICEVASNTWRFWNEFSADWVQRACAEQARLEQARGNPVRPGNISSAAPCPAWLGIWLKQCADARTAGKPEPTPASVRESMLERSLNPMEPRESLNQLIVQALARAQPTAATAATPAPAPPPEPQGVELWA